MHKSLMFSLAIFGLLALGVGCGWRPYPASLVVNAETIDAIIADGTLDPQQKRDALAALDIDEVTINGLLRDERLANQFGGTLRGAYDKVVDEQMNTMTPDEIQLYGDATGIVEYDDDEAQAIVDFFEEAEITSADELEEYLDDVTQELPSDINDSDLSGVFIDTDTDVVLDEIP